MTKDNGCSKGDVIQTMDYYPFGAEFCDKNSKSLVQNHKYNGKEFDHMHGLNTYDYGARQYNPVTGRWDRMDPLCEKYYSTSPYAYCVNNPVRFIDPDGKVVAQIFGGIVGAGMEYASQVTTNILTEGFSASAFTNVDVFDIGVATAEGALTCGTSTLNKGVRIGAKIAAELAIANIDINISNGKTEMNVNGITETVTDAAVGLTTGSAKIPTNKVSPFKTQTVTQAAKSARSQAHSQGKSFTKEQYKETAKRTKKSNAEKKTMNKTTTNVVQHAGGTIDGVLQAGYEKIKNFFGFGK